MRSTSTASSSRLVITAAVCGSDSQPKNVAPPLKSTSTKFSSSGECVAASATTRVRSSSDLPEPVAPMHSPCGPIPPSAASFKSRYTGAPSGVAPMGTVSLLRTPGHIVCASNASTSGTPSMDRKSPPASTAPSGRR